TLWMEFCNQLLVRYALVVISIQSCSPHTCQHFRETRLSVQVRPQHQRVYKEPDERLNLYPGAVCNGCSYGNIRLPTMPKKEHLPARKQDHEQARLVLSSKFAETLGQLSRNLKTPGCSAKSGFLGGWIVPRQFQDWAILELAAPVAHL